MAVTVTIRKFTSFTVTSVDAFGTLQELTVIGSGFTYDPAGNPTGGTINTLVYKDYGAPGVVVHTHTVSGFTATPFATLAAQVTPPALWYDPAFNDTFAAFNQNLVNTENFYGQFSQITGGSLADNLNGTTGNDLIYGGINNDRIDGKGGSDLMFGGLGNDRLTADLSGASQLYGGQGNDLLTGSSFNDTLDGGIGVDAIYGGARNDEAYGGSGDDLIVGFTGDDLLWGDAGNDRVSGGVGNDTLYGVDGNDRVFGGSDDDLVYGGLGNDAVQGGTGADAISGDGGNDSLNGGDGDDVIKFGDGSDNVVGLNGSDTFVFALGGAVGVTNVVDFIVVDDFIALGDATFNLGVARTAAENFAFFVSHSVSALNGTTFTGSDGNQVFFRQVNLAQLTVAHFVDTDGTATQFL